MNLRPLLWRLDTVFNYRAKGHRAAFKIGNRLPRWLREAVIVNAAVRATSPDVIGPDAYAGSDGLDYKRLMDHA